MRYLSFRLHYEGTELVIRSGIIFRNERHVPYVRIQNLDAIRNVATAPRRHGSSRRNRRRQAPEATNHVLHGTVFEEMRRRIFEGRARAGQADVEQVDAPDPGDAVVESPPLLHLPLRELFLDGLLDDTAPLSWRRRSACCRRTVDAIAVESVLRWLARAQDDPRYAAKPCRREISSPGRIALIIVAIIVLLLLVHVL